MKRRLVSFAFAASALIAAGFAVALLAVYELHQTNREVCRRVGQLDQAIVATLHRSEANLPKITYFRHHPRELAAQLADVRHQLRLFAPPHC